MYHLSNDKRRLASAEKIYQGLEKCLAKRSFDEISVSDINKASFIARTTFYRNFDTTLDVLAWKCDTSFHDILSKFSPRDFLDEGRLIEGYFAYWMKNSHILEELLAINRIDIIYSSHLKNAEALSLTYGKIEGLEGMKAKYFIAIRTGVTIGVLSTWIKNGKKETPAEIQGILKNTLEQYKN